MAETVKIQYVTPEEFDAMKQGIKQHIAAAVQAEREACAAIAESVEAHYDKLKTEADSGDRTLGDAYANSAHVAGTIACAIHRRSKADQ